ncbi:MAG: acyl-CoA thioesterase [Planctomycetota bacterium]|nr:acyl-CoA thioesterase [Planctomycetota bacterium]MEC8817943.1 acyl-CoA thioesterase [Planctomycetota bacterium]MEC9158174.1 acyl-CoA thioesterase [Planctomycetota bacterium]MEC9232745.1 acyl-CoA thioesterase [Planctomycetota bacterium]MED5506500.1 acyl-CoA thioesterase [Planctomycetota bacterium]
MHDDSKIALRVLMMPSDTNHEGTIFGGVILSHIDQAAYVEARHHGVHRWVTAAVDRVDFLQPVFMGDIVSYWTRTTRKGTSSVTVNVEVMAQRHATGHSCKVTTAELVMVAMGPEGRPRPYSDVDPFEEPPATDGGAGR